MNQLQTFNFESGEIRTQLINGEPWFVANDICKYFGVSNRNRVLQKLDDEEKGGTRVDTPGGSQEVTIINESGLYSLLFALEPRQARGIPQKEVERKFQKVRQFKRWVTSEVLPSIRKHGAYMTPEKIEETLLNPDTIIQLATQLKEERLEKELAHQQLKQQEPQVVFARTVEVSQNSVAVKVLATVLKQNGLNIGQNRMFQWLRDNKYLSGRQGKSWNMPTQKSMDLGLFELKPNTFFHNNGVPETNYTPLVTGKGQVYFVNKFIELSQEV